jgi:hypothetical protein
MITLSWLPSLVSLCRTTIQDSHSGKAHARTQLHSLVALKEFTAAMVMGWSFCRHVSIIAAGHTIMLMLINSPSLLYTSTMSMEPWFVPAAMSCLVSLPARYGR